MDESNKPGLEPRKPVFVMVACKVMVFRYDITLVMVRCFLLVNIVTLLF